MGISKLFLNEIIQICSFLDSEKINLDKKENLIFLGDQDIRVNLKQIINSKNIYKLETSKYQKCLNYKKEVSLYDLFPSKLSSKVIIKTIDINGNPDLKIDITNSEDLKKEFLKNGSVSQFIDIGTIEHVIDPYKALCNISKLLKVNGIVSHLSPCSSYLNHGYYCISPQLFYDFYKNKGYEILRFNTLSYIGNYDSNFSLCINLKYDHQVEISGLRATLKQKKWKKFVDSLIRRLLLRFCRETYVSFTAIKNLEKTKNEYTLYQKQYEKN